MTHNIIEAQLAHAAAIDALLDRALGPGRLARTAERLRENNHPVDGLSFIVENGDGLRGSISFWPIAIGAQSGLLLGPLAIAPSAQGQGLGQALLRHSLARIDPTQFPVVLLVGDLPYYEKAGFAVAPSAVRLPGPVDPRRLLVRGDAAICAALQGDVRPAPELC